MDRYQRLRKIGEGAFGKAVLVQHKQTNRQCVVKEINITKMASKEREQARKEVAVLAQLKHPNIVTYIDSFEEAGTLYIVMNFCAGGDLHSRIINQKGVPFQEEQIWNWFVQLCLAIKHIHDRKILHRDIKSQNIFLTTSGAVQLGDFGIAKVLSDTVELARTCIGTPYYLSPEIVENKPYNNKSDIWSLGCVLYEVTTLKHAFEAPNMKNLVLKIIRGSYPPIPPQYSFDLRGLVAQLFKRAPRDRPSINSILRKTFIMQKVRSLMPAEQIAEEFSHTVMHGAKIAHAPPPTPRPSSAPQKPPQKPGSVGQRYNPARIYGVPVNLNKKSQSRSSNDLRKKGSGNRPLPIPGQAEWDRKKKDVLDKEQKHKEAAKKEEESFAKRHNKLLEKQKMERMQKAKEEGWRNLMNLSDSDKKDQAPSRPQVGGDARPLPIPNAKGDPGHPNYLDIRANREPGNYAAYMAHLDKLKNDRIEREKEIDKRANYMQAPQPTPVLNKPAQGNCNQLNWGRPQSPALQAAQQGNIERQKGAEAAERARIMAEYLQRRKEAAQNKARGQADLYGGRPPSAGRRQSPVPKSGSDRGGGAQGRNKEEQEYLEKLRQIRLQNVHEKRAIKERIAGDDHIAQKKPLLDSEAEERRKKAEALKQQAEDWAQRKKGALELERQELMKRQRAQEDLMRQQADADSDRSKVNLQPAPAVPITGALHLIGVGDKAAGCGKIEDSHSVQHRKSEILKRLNDKNPVPADAGGVEMRGKWKAGSASPLAVAQCDTPEPDSSRPQWDKEANVRLSNLPLELTASQMEATSARDKVIKNPQDIKENPQSARNQWGRPGSTVVKLLNEMPVLEETLGLDNHKETAAEAPLPTTPKPAIGSTITLSKPSAATAPPIPPKPTIKSGTITIQASTATTAQCVASTAAKMGVVAGKGNAMTTMFMQLTPSHSESKATNTTAEDLEHTLAGEDELPGSIRFVESTQGQGQLPSESPNKHLQTVVEVTETSETAGLGLQSVSEKIAVQSDIDVGKEIEIKNREGQEPGSVLVKPPLAKKPDLLPKPVLLPKPITPYLFSEHAPEVRTSVSEDNGLFKKTHEQEASEGEKKEKPDKEDEQERSHSVKKGLSTGNFDMKNAELLRTCSEPDLTRLFRATVKCVEATLRLHQSLDLSQPLDGKADEFEDSEKDAGDLMSPISDENKYPQKAEHKDEEEPVSNDMVDEEEEEDLKLMRATMQSLLFDDNDDDEGSSSDRFVKFSLSSDTESLTKSGGNRDEADGENHADGCEDDKPDDENEGAARLDKPGHKPSRSKSESAINGQRKNSSLEEEVEQVKEENGEVDEEYKYNELDVLQLNDSDDETDFGDEDDADDLDLFGRLEQHKAELEKELGFDKFIEVYKAVQALQEDEDVNMEEGAQIAIDILGEAKQHLYPKIFQLVMADTAFTEDNI